MRVLAACVGMAVLVSLGQAAPATAARATRARLSHRRLGEQRATLLRLRAGGGFTPKARHLVNAGAASLVVAAALSQAPAPSSAATADSAVDPGGDADVVGGSGDGGGVLTRPGGPPGLAWHAMGVERCLVLQASSALGGLSSSDAAGRRARYGVNALQAAPRPSVWALVAEQFQDRLVQVPRPCCKKGQG